MKWRYGNVSESFHVDVGTFLSDRSILLADVTEAIFMVKTARVDVDANALATLGIGTGITKVPAAGSEPDKLAFSFSATDFGTGFLEKTGTGSPYYIGMGIKDSGMTTYLEIDLADDRLEIYSDFIHDN